MRKRVKNHFYVLAKENKKGCQLAAFYELYAYSGLFFVFVVLVVLLRTTFPFRVAFWHAFRFRKQCFV